MNRQLVAVRERMRTRRRLEAALADTRTALVRERARCEELEAKLRQEGADVERLEGLSLAGLFYAVLGSKEEQLEKERKEYLAAKLRHDASADAVRAMEQEMSEIEDRLVQLGDPEAEYQALLDQKNALVMQAGGARAERLLRLSEALADARSDAREVREAISAGVAVLDGLDRAAGALESARGWGTWDMIGGGIVATAVKHSRIDEARAAIHSVQELLRRFRRELADVEAEPDLGVDLSSFETFADYFLDGLIVDWIVQSRIQESLERVSGTRGTVQALVADLETELDGVERRAEGIEKERRALLEGA